MQCKSDVRIYTPSLVQRYQIFSTIENSKRLKDGQEGQLDLQSYVEFKRNYRAVVRMHKAALAAQRDMRQLLQHPALRASAMQSVLSALDAAAAAAQRVSRRVLERYPNSGKLLRCYDKFLEDIPGMSRKPPIGCMRMRHGMVVATGCVAGLEGVCM
ncbi:hypothetical protein Vretimale_18597 [Volvox reticuliferus]|uniref:TmcB/TmcC TPR repeats domain-containing protein n=1 Tax=Volvox reticuliferus TaxID=1737510 RepID=A0A8J4GVB4_9CHLO|nr:hypothetical protein Vretimale_18597 [Volvox reticuliferus]